MATTVALFQRALVKGRLITKSHSLNGPLQGLNCTKEQLKYPKECKNPDPGLLVKPLALTIQLRLN